MPLSKSSRTTHLLAFPPFKSAHHATQVPAVERRLSRRYRASLAVEGAVVGLAAGAVVTLYRLTLSGAEKLMRTLVGLASTSALGVAAWLAFGLLLTSIVGALIVKVPHTISSGIPQTEAEVAGQLNMSWWRVMIAKFIEGSLCALGGLSLGREGPSVQLGGMAGKAVAKTFNTRRGEERMLVTCGAAAGMSAAFSAPLTGVMFAIEEIHKVFSAPLVGAVMCAAVTSDFLCSQILGVRPVIHYELIANLPHRYYEILLLMGVFLGVLGVLHNLGMFWCQRLYSKISARLPYSRLAIPFIITGIAAFFVPQLLGGGDGILTLLEAHALPSIQLVFFLLLGKYLLTTLAFGSGAPGGTLFPLVVMGILSGVLFGQLISAPFSLGTMYIQNFAVLGIAGLFAGVVRAPITGVVLVFELTGSLDSLLSAALVSLVAYITADMLNVDGFYEHLLTKLLGASDSSAMTGLRHSPEKLVRIHIVEAGSKVEGKLIKDITWPNKTLIVTIVRCGAEIVPRGSTKILALDKLLVLMDERDEDATEQALHELCEGIGAREFT